MAADGTEDVRKQLSAIKYAEEPDAAKHKKYRAWFTGEANAPRWLGFFDTMLSKSSTSFVAAKSALPISPILVQMNKIGPYIWNWYFDGSNGRRFSTIPCSVYFVARNSSSITSYFENPFVDTGKFIPKKGNKTTR